jgi:hypothetical protein
MIGRRALDRFFDAIELADAVERLLSDRGGSSGINIEEFARTLRSGSPSYFLVLQPSSAGISLERRQP